MLKKKANTFHFETPVILVGPADVNFEVLRPFLNSTFPLIAADGGANQLIAKNVVPDIVIGDFDSFDASLEVTGELQYLKVKEQETSDFDKCIYSIEAPQFLAFGFIGNRFDHTLASINTLVRYHQQKNILLVGSDDFSFLVTGDFVYSGIVDQNISVFPVTPIQFESSRGLAFPLNKLSMEIGTRIGTSNKTNAENILIRPTPEHVYTPYLITLPLSNLGKFTDAY